MQTVAHAAPITSLHLLNIEGSAEDQQTQHHYADKTEVHSPQYVFFDFHSSSVFFSCYLDTSFSNSYDRLLPSNLPVEDSQSFHRSVILFNFPPP
jgi:hypothetical protein